MVMWEEVVWEPVLCRRQYWRDKKFFPQEEGERKVQTSFVDVRGDLLYKNNCRQTFPGLSSDTDVLSGHHPSVASSG